MGSTFIRLVKKITALLILFSLSFFAFAQTDLKLPASVTLHALYSSRQESVKLKNPHYFYNISEGVRFQVPVFQAVNVGRARFFALIIKGNGSLDQPFISSFQHQPQFIKLGAGINALYHFKKQHTVIAACKISVSEDEQTIQQPFLRTISTLLYNHQSSKFFSFSLGGIAATNYKGLRFFPLLGIQLRSERSRFLMLFPLCFDLNYSVTSKLVIGAKFSPNGNLNRFYTHAYDPSLLLHKESIFRVRHMDLTAYFRLKLNRQITLGMQGGWMFASRMIVTTSSYTKKTALERGVFAGIHLHYRFIKAKSKGLAENPDEEDLNLYDITVDDLINY